MSETKELTHQEKLDALQARTMAAEKRRKAQAEQVELAEAEAEALATEALAEIEAKHGEHAKTRVTMLQVVPGRYVILQRGPEVIYSKFDADLTKFNRQRKDVPESVFWNFVRPLVAYPDTAAFEKIITELPGALTSLVMQGRTLYGNKPEEDQKK